MGLNKDELKAKLMKELSEAVDTLVEKWEAGSTTTLSEIEDLALTLSAHVSQHTTQTLAQTSEAKGPVAVVSCPECGQKARYKGQKERYVSTRSGDIQIKRRYYYCETCRHGFFPP